MIIELTNCNVLFSGIIIHSLPFAISYAAPTASVAITGVPCSNASFTVSPQASIIPLYD